MLTSTLTKTFETSCSAGTPLRMKTMRLACVQNVFRILCWPIALQVESAHLYPFETSFTLLAQLSNDWIPKQKGQLAEGAISRRQVNLCASSARYAIRQRSQLFNGRLFSQD